MPRRLAPSLAALLLVSCGDISGDSVATTTNDVGGPNFQSVATHSPFALYKGPCKLPPLVQSRAVICIEIFSFDTSLSFDDTTIAELLLQLRSASDGGLVGICSNVEAGIVVAGGVAEGLRQNGEKVEIEYLDSPCT